MSEYSPFQDMMFDLLQSAMELAREPVVEAEVERKPDTTYVCSTDKAIQARMVSDIRRNHPDHAVIAEESDEGDFARPQEARYCWVIDPLDGTRNYVGGLPCFSTAIALLDRGMPVLAAVGEPNVNRIFIAEKGRGTRRDRIPVRVRDPHLDRTALIGLTTNRDPLSLQFLERWARVGGFILRNLGSTAYHMALVSDGSLHGCASRKCKIWDIAAGALLIEEAGGVVTHEDGRPLIPFDLGIDPEQNIPVIAGAPGTHERLIRLRQADAD